MVKKAKAQPTVSFFPLVVEQPDGNVVQTLRDRFKKSSARLLRGSGSHGDSRPGDREARP
jgi:hypothetical protein